MIHAGTDDDEAIERERERQKEILKMRIDVSEEQNECYVNKQNKKSPAKKNAGKWNRSEKKNTKNKEK